MKSNRSYVVTAVERRGESLYSKVLLVLLLLALLFASLPAARALAAPANDSGTIDRKTLEQGWQNKLNNLRWAGYFYDHAQFYPSDFERPADLARVQELLEKYGIALRAATTIVQTHAGFDIEGKLINEVQADKSIRDLAMYLQMMRGLREKIDEVPGGK